MIACDNGRGTSTTTGWDPFNPAANVRYIRYIRIDTATGTAGAGKTELTVTTRRRPAFWPPNPVQRHLALPEAVHVPSPINRRRLPQRELADPRLFNWMPTAAS